MSGQITSDGDREFYPPFAALLAQAEAVRGCVLGVHGGNAGEEVNHLAELRMMRVGHGVFPHETRKRALIRGSAPAKRRSRLADATTAPADEPV